jgi:polyisoprenoid-binding protein YceI
MKKLLLLCLTVLLSFNAQADWKLNDDQSSVNFISIKKSTVGEVNHFNSLSGSLKNGSARVVIDLSSVETNIPIRNERMQKMLFEVSKFSSATITAEIDSSKLDSLKGGERYQENINLILDLHGITNKITATVQVIKLSNSGILVYSVIPVIINASDFGLANGVEALREIANLPVISAAIPVTFSLVFNK